MENRMHYSSGAKWEAIVGYSRAVRAGNQIEVSGTCSVDHEGVVYAPENAYEQTKRILQIIENALHALNGKMEDIVRTRIYVTNIDDWQEIGRAHGEVFHTIRPVTTMIEVSRLIGPEYLVEIEATAILSN